MDKYDPEYLDDEERELIESIGEPDPKKLNRPTPEQQSELKRAAGDYLKRHETKMNIRIDPAELERIKERAQREGLRYQTLIKSVLHKYITGQLVESNREAG
jgi:predicted DNA binding CopG/RHH family protein